MGGLYEIAAGRSGGGSAMTLKQDMDVDGFLFDPSTQIIVCCGSGGVGKTTTAAAMALRAAEGGRRVVVLTIDPARRLAQSMGLEELDNTPRPVLGVQGEGTLDAMMLDMKRTFDELVEAHTEPERAQQVLDNPFYQSLSSSFAGTQEYMAMEKLGQLRAQSDAEDLWDLIVVDTPPSRSASGLPRRTSAVGLVSGRTVHPHLGAPARGAGKGLGRVVWCRVWPGDRGPEQGLGNTTAQRRVLLCASSREHFRWVSCEGGVHLRAPQGTRNGVHGGRGTRAGCDSRGDLFRGPTCQ